MANPQKEDGFTAIANELAEQFARLELNGSQWRIVWAVLRLTYGWRRKTRDMPLELLQEHTELSVKLLSRELKKLVERRVLIRQGSSQYPKSYGLEKDYDKWVASRATFLPNGRQTPTRLSTKQGTKPPQVCLPNGRKNELAPKEIKKEEIREDAVVPTEWVSVADRMAYRFPGQRKFRRILPSQLHEEYGRQTTAEEVLTWIETVRAAGVTDCSPRDLQAEYERVVADSADVPTVPAAIRDRKHYNDWLKRRAAQE